MKLPLAAFLLALAASAAPTCASASVPAPIARAIAIAEDQRRWADGELRADLAHANADVRARAARAVGRLQDSTSVDALLPLLGDRSAAVRREAAFALGQLGRREARSALEGALADRDTAVVDLAIEALGKLGDRAASARIVPLLAARSARQRGDAAEALWRLADTSVAGALIDRLGERDPAVRWRVVYALEKLPLPARIVPAVAPLLEDPDARVRAHAARTLGRLKSTHATGALLAATHDADAAVVVNAVRALEQVADSTSYMVMQELTRLLGHPDPHVTATAANAFGDHFVWAGGEPADARQALEALVAAAGAKDAATRGSACRALLMNAAGRFERIWRRALQDDSPYVRAAVLDGLRQVGSDGASAAPELLSNSMLPGHPLLERMTAAEILGQMGGRRPADFGALLPGLRQGVGDPEPLVAAACAGALGDWGDTASVALLAGAYAARAIDAGPDARQAIRDALRQLAGRAFADSVERAHPALAPPVAYPPDFQDPPRETRAVLHTRAGDIEWQLLGREAPQTVRNFVRLARKGYFDGLVVHRVVPDFVIQDGDPTGTGSGGPGYTIRCEYNPLRYEAGMVGMALSGKDTGGSQWFITLSPQPHLNGRYTIFARVVRGLDVARRVTQGTEVRTVEILP